MDIDQLYFLLIVAFLASTLSNQGGNYYEKFLVFLNLLGSFVVSNFYHYEAQFNPTQASYWGALSWSDSFF
ncbi:hypothetical protein AOQ84DRAFT_31237 [Glonium stellatum]|uniref:Uncharacterized protein n=1 Tax=Glonium stellatum TaxID=574774 RepID=A0A8E2F1N7_9PEZI|nr:hypothetical protein AOQ84DRAFT_31237 [Glonium stellatum]